MLHHSSNVRTVSTRPLMCVGLSSITIGFSSIPGVVNGLTPNDDLLATLTR